MNIATVLNHIPSILEESYLVTGLDQIQSHHPILQVGLNGTVTSPARACVTRHKKEHPPMKSSDNASDYKPHLRVIDPICLSLVIAYVLGTFTDAEVIKLHQLTTSLINEKREKVRKTVTLSPASINHCRHYQAQYCSDDIYK